MKLKRWVALLLLVASLLSVSSAFAYGGCSRSSYWYAGGGALAQAACDIFGTRGYSGGASRGGVYHQLN